MRAVNRALMNVAQDIAAFAAMGIFLFSAGLWLLP
jgi:hypothetical protein